MCCSESFVFCLGSDAWAVLLALSGVPLPEAPPGHVCIPRHSSLAWDLVPRAQLLKILQCVCRELVGFRIMRLCRVQMLPFAAASEPGNVLSETVQRKVSQCVAAVCLSLVPVQMTGLFCFVFGGYPCRKHLQDTFAFCAVPNPSGI